MGFGSGPNKGVLAVQSALSSLKRQGVRYCDIQGILLHISGSSEMSADDVESVNRYISSLVPIDTHIESGVVVIEDLGDDVMIVSAMAAEMLFRDITAIRLRSPDSWVTMCNEDLRCIPAFERKKWFMEGNSSLLSL
jgi:cell division GTPase FtsZ